MRKSNWYMHMILLLKFYGSFYDDIENLMKNDGKIVQGTLSLKSCNKMSRDTRAHRTTPLSTHVNARESS